MARHLSSGDLDAVNSDAEKNSATEKQNEALEATTPTLQQRFGSKVSLTDADETDDGNDVGDQQDDEEGRDAEGGEGQSQEAHLNVRERSRIVKK